MNGQANHRPAGHLARIRAVAGRAAPPDEITNAILALASISVTPLTSKATRDTVRSARWLVAYSKRIVAHLDALALMEAYLPVRFQTYSS